MWDYFLGSSILNHYFPQDCLCFLHFISYGTGSSWDTVIQKFLCNYTNCNTSIFCWCQPKASSAVIK
jgi:hypothetical protein